MRNKLTSRKFWVCVAAFLSSIATSIAGYSFNNEAIVVVGIICATFSAGIYAAMEAVTDMASLDSNMIITEYKETNNTDYNKGYTDAVEDVINTVSDMKED